MASRRDKIKFCLDDYLTTLSPEEHSNYLLDNTTLISIIHTGATDEKILSKAKKHDEDNGTDLFSEVIKYRIYCIACHKFDCTC